MPQMRVDLHCDYLTAAAPETPPMDLETGNALQCFAVFLRDDAAAAYAAAVGVFKSLQGFTPVRTAGEAIKVLEDRSASALTCENIGFTRGEESNIQKLAKDGVIMASLVWNTENSLARPNVRKDGRREERGLKEAGRRALAALDENRIIVDISHLSDGGVAEILTGRKIPVVASHSCCNALCQNPRNLTDGQLRAIAGCGGVVGVNFYKKFLGGGIEAVAEHILHIIDVAGEDVPALGSDWDGVPNGGSALYPRDMPRLFELLKGRGLPPRVVEKVACKNFLRVFSAVRP